MEKDMSRLNSFISNFKQNKNLRFFGKLLLFILILFWYTCKIFPQYTGEYNASFIDKHARLKATEEPKLVLIGDSNLTFGINSALLEEAFNMPVVNMGFHGGAENPFHEEMAKLNVTEGDIYVLCHTDYEDEDAIGAMYAWLAIENHFDLWDILRPEDIANMTDYFPYYLKKCLYLYANGTGNIDKQDVYARSAFNEYGDIAFPRIGCEHEFALDVLPPSINETTVTRINELNEYLNDRGATLLVAGYPIGNGKYTTDIDEFIKFQNDLTESLDCPVISNYLDYMFDYSYFYNTPLHLNSEGADLRTNQLIADIQRWQTYNTDAVSGNDFYEDIAADANLCHITDLEEYFTALSAAKERYTVFISSKGSLADDFDSSILSAAKTLNLNLSSISEQETSYLTVIDRGTVSEKNGSDLIVLSGAADNNRIHYSIQSGGISFEESGSILINDLEYSKDAIGLNIVVYSNELHRILDQVTFSPCEQGFEAVRYNPLN